VADSDLRLLVIDTSEPWTEQDSKLLARVCPLGPLLVAGNKCDLPPQVSPDQLEKLLERVESERTGSEARSTPPLSGLERAGLARVEIVWTSALTGEGLAELREKILDLAAPTRGAGSEGEFITDLRHQQLLSDCLKALGRARQAAEKCVPHEMLLLDLYDALHALDEISGATTVEEVLGVIFATFCVGK
jgi:tRNA modification GTPase